MHNGLSICQTKYCRTSDYYEMDGQLAWRV